MRLILYSFLFLLLVSLLTFEKLEETTETLNLNSNPPVSIDTTRKIVDILSGHDSTRVQPHFARLAGTIQGTTFWFEDIDPFMVARLVHTESRGDSLAVSSVGAIGLGQIRPEFWEGVFPQCGDNLRRMRDNICYTVHILDHYQKRSHNMRSALLLYNGCQSAHCEWYARTVMDD